MRKINISRLFGRIKRVNLREIWLSAYEKIRRVNYQGIWHSVRERFTQLHAFLRRRPRISVATIAVIVTGLVVWQLSSYLPFAADKKSADTGKSATTMQTSSTINQESKAENKVFTVSIGVYGDASLPDVKQEEIVVAEGEYVVITPPEGVLFQESEGMKSRLLKTRRVDLCEAICFNRPGKKGIYFFGKEQARTAFQAKESGRIRFSIAYPDTFMQSYSVIGVEKDNIVGPVEIRVEVTGEKPEFFSEPRKIVRAKSLIGTFAPGLAVEEKERDFDLMELAREKNKKSAEKKPAEKNKNSKVLEVSI